jgi:hypothetical protein
VNPAGERDGLPDVSRAQFVAMMRAFHVQFRGNFYFVPCSYEHSHNRSKRTRMMAGIGPHFKEILGVGI